MTKLVNGLIPANTDCPFRSCCSSARLGNCHHLGAVNPRPYSCGTARAFDLIEQRKPLEPAPEVFDATKMDTRMPFMYYHTTKDPSKCVWVVKLAECWDTSTQDQAWMGDRLLNEETQVPTLDIEETQWVFDSQDPLKNEVLALRKMQELWASLDFTGRRTA